MKHNAGGDSEITLRIFVAVVLQRTRELHAKIVETKDGENLEPIPNR
jgi:hypothetical protein